MAPQRVAEGGVSGFGSMKGEINLPSYEEWKEMDREIEQTFEESEIFPDEGSRSEGD